MNVLDRIELTPPTGYVVVRRAELWLVRDRQAQYIDGDRNGLVGPLLAFTPAETDARAEEHLLTLMRKHVNGYPDYFTAEIDGRHSLAASWTDGVRDLITMVLDVGGLVEIDFSWFYSPSHDHLHEWRTLTRAVRFDR